MKENPWVKRVEDFVSDTLSDNRRDGKTTSDWAFGGVIFAAKAGMITVDEMDAILKKHRLVWYGDSSGS